VGSGKFQNMGKKERTAKCWKRSLQSKVMKRGFLLKRGRKVPGQRFHRFSSLPDTWMVLVLQNITTGEKDIVEVENKDVDLHIFENKVIADYYHQVERQVKHNKNL
jgi:hypothetical protein